MSTAIKSDVLTDQHELEIKETLADILACIFAAAHGMDDNGYPSNDQEMVSTTIQTAECVGRK